MSFIITCSRLIFLFSMSLQASEIVVNIQNFKEVKGRMAWALFNIKDGFPSKKETAFKRGFWDFDNEKEKVSNHDFSTFEVTRTLTDLEDGEYALSVYQDLNGDSKLNTNWLGIPREPAGVSQNPKIRMGPPSFDESKFVLKSAINLEIKLHH